MANKPTTPSKEGDDRELDGAAILAVQDLQLHKEKVPEWGGFVYLREITAEERGLFDAKVLDLDGRKDYRNVRAALLLLALSDSTGRRLFADDSQIDKLNQKSAKVLDRLFNRARELNGMMPVAVRALKKT